MARAAFVVAGMALTAFAEAQSTTYRAIPTLPATVNQGPSLVPNILDPTAPNSQDLCRGYIASNVQQVASGFTADLNLAGPHCDTYGIDLEQLILLVEYQAKERLHVQIIPKYLAAENYTQYFLPPALVGGYPGNEPHNSNDLALEWKNDPDFQFQVKRVSSGDVIFSTYGHKIVYQNQFLELATSMIDNYKVYGLAENIHDFLLGTNYTQVYYNADAGNTIDENVYGTHPFYIENKYGKGPRGSAAAHGVYARNAHGQEWLLRQNSITYRTLGGAFDFYFLSGPTPQAVTAQYQSGVVGLPAMQMYWTFGFHQCRWGYQNWSVLQDVVDNYRNADIPLEVIWTDIDYMDQYRDFTNGAMNFPVPAGQEFLARLHANNQHYIPIVDSNIYAPDPVNASDSYATFTRGAEQSIFIRNGEDSFYYGDNWPGFSVWVDWLLPGAVDYWTNELVTWYQDIQYDAIWIDLSEASSFCIGSCGEGNLDRNPVHPPFKLPGEAGNVDYGYPDGFNITNATEAAAASSASSVQAASNSATVVSTSATATATFTRTPPSAERNLTNPPYVINNVFSGHYLGVSSISPNATHSDRYNSTEYDLHNIFGSQIVNATYQALLKVFPGRRPFVLGRAQFAGFGTVGAHWGGDNTSKWGSMYLSISQAFTFMIAGIPMFGADTCGFASNTDFELCTRWMQLSAFFPFYRNHNVFAAISQEAYIWSSTATASRIVMQIRYSLLPYMYTLFYHAHTAGAMVMRPLQFEFPDDASLAGVDNQLLLGPSILVTPVLLPGATSVKGVFPGSPQTVWYDWYTLQPENVKPGENKTLDAPLEHINVHVRGGSILPLQQPGYTTEESRKNPWSLLITLDRRDYAEGDLYLDDGLSIQPNATKNVYFKFFRGLLQVDVQGGYVDTNPLANITIAGWKSGRPNGMQYGGYDCFGQNGVGNEMKDQVLKVTGLEGQFKDGAWARSFDVQFR